MRRDGRLVPFEAYNLFYRGGRESVLATIRDEIDAGRERRRAPLTGHTTPVRVVGRR